MKSTDFVQRKPLRLKGYDYSQNGVYFITICTKDNKCILSNITVGATNGRPCDVELTNTGKIVENGICGIEKHYENVNVDSYVIMPDHIHLIIRIDNQSGRAMLVPTVSRIIQQFKGYITKQIGQLIWQKSYYDHIIRDDEDYYIKARYIEENPLRWCLKNKLL